MSIQYRKLERKVTYAGKTKTMYNAKIIHSGVIDQRELAKRISEKSGMSTGDVTHAIEELNEMFVELLAQGYIIDLGVLGRFKAGLNSKACDKPEQVSVKTITEVTCNYKPGKEIKKALNSVSLEADRRVDEHGEYVENSHKKKH
ncbi:MAG: HU family DNA-binding protein [Bacteroidales bacterium]|nr:HU family DNA-binding protein [Bacteroidales bacterium]